MKTETKTVGCFELTPLQEGKWRVLNLLTGVPHSTFGTRKEVEDQARLQTKAWERKKNKTGPKGAAWRSTMLAR